MLHQNNRRVQKPEAPIGVAIATRSPAGSTSRTNEGGEPPVSDRSLCPGRQDRPRSRPCTARRTPSSVSVTAESRGSIARQRDHRAGAAAGLALDAVERQRVVERDVAASGPTQATPVGAGARALAEVVRQRADVEAGGAVDAQRDQSSSTATRSIACRRSTLTGAGRAGGQDGQRPRRASRVRASR